MPRLNRDFEYTTEVPHGPQPNERNALDSRHVFERANLGTAPFRVVGFHKAAYQACHGAPVQPAGGCHYCGQCIMYVWTIRGADGREFTVGCDCVARTGDGGLLANVKKNPEYRTMMREQRHARAAGIKAEVDTFLADSIRAAAVLGPDYHRVVNSVRYSGMAGYARNRAEIRRAIKAFSDCSKL